MPKPGTNREKRETGKQLLRRISKEMRAEAKRLESSGKRDLREAQTLREKATAMRNGKKT